MLDQSLTSECGAFIHHVDHAIRQAPSQSFFELAIAWGASGAYQSGDIV